MVPKIARTSFLYQELVVAERILAEHLKSATHRQILALLSKLRLHYPLTNLASNQVQILLNDYLEDLGIYPFDILSAICLQYRQNSLNSFFPKIAELLAPIREKWVARKWQLVQIKILLAKAEKEQDLDFDDNRLLIKTIQKEVEAMIKELQANQ
ncbi:hypothetical protein NOVO_01700 [Rickettsiales bacterium Ac37b]|nr:hypothetical protein NOVO_01700 [Rickettsiales bacterium Ac37b]